MKNTGSEDPGKKLILIVEDDKAVMDSLDSVLRREGFKLEKAFDGEEALRKGKALHPDLILLDLMLPKLSGFEILREFQGGDTSDIPIVILTGYYADNATMEMMNQESNVKDFLVKPIDRAALTTRLHTLLKTHSPLENNGGC